MSTRPNPLGAESLDDLVTRLRALREWAGSPSYARIAQEVSRRRRRGRAPVSRATVYDCFRLGRARIDVDLLVDIVSALGVPPAEAVAWRQAHAAAMGLASTASVADVQSAIRPPIATFTGREAELAELTTRPWGSTALITGMAGVGKTELAIQLADAVTRALTDPVATFFVDLRGYDRSHQPADPAAVLGALLAAAGYSAGAISRLPARQRGAEWREWARERRFVAVLDNAADENQVRPLLPDVHGGLVVVTGRRRLGELSSVQRLELQPLPLDDAVTLLGRAGQPGEHAPRWRAGDEEISRLAELCGRLPLALTLTARHLANHPRWSMADHVRRLETTAREEAVRPALDLSYRSLTPDQQRAFRLLALHPGPSVSPPAVAALIDHDVAETGKLTESLRGEHLVRQDGSGAVALHDLIREYGRAVLHQEEAYTAQRAAVGRLLEHYVHACAQAVRSLWSGSGEEDRFPPGPPPPMFPIPMPDPAAWLDAERQAIVMAATLAEEYDQLDSAARLAAILCVNLSEDGRFEHAEILLDMALRSGDPQHRARAHRDLAQVYQDQSRYDDALHQLWLATQAGPDSTPGRTHTLMGSICEELGRRDEAVEHYRRAEEEARAAGDECRVARTKHNLAYVYRLQGRVAEAERMFDEAIEMSTRLDDQIALLYMYGNRGLMYETMGRLDEAKADILESLRLVQEQRRRRLLPSAHAALARIENHRGSHADALAHARQSLEHATELDDPRGACEGKIEIGRSLAAVGQTATAIESLEAALADAQESNLPVIEAHAAARLGELVLTTGDHAGAGEMYQRARRLGEETSEVEPLARAHAGLGDCALATGDTDEAARQWRLAIGHFEQMRAPEAGRLRERLTGLSSQASRVSRSRTAAPAGTSPRPGTAQ